MEKITLKKLYPIISQGSWSYVVNENNNAIRITLEGFGSCTPIEEMQKMIDNLNKKQFEDLWNECEVKKDIID